MHLFSCEIFNCRAPFFCYFQQHKSLKASYGKNRPSNRKIQAANMFMKSHSSIIKSYCKVPASRNSDCRSLHT